jgi:archaeal flagellar protein FlaI
MMVLKSKKTKVPAKTRVRFKTLFRRAVAGYKIIQTNGYMNYRNRMYNPYAGMPGFEIRQTEINVNEQVKQPEKPQDTSVSDDNTGIQVIPSDGKFGKMQEPDYSLRDVNINYDLIKMGSKVFASANVIWSDADSSLVYTVREPALSQQERYILNQIKTILIEKLDVDFAALRKDEAKEYLTKKFEEMLAAIAPGMSEDRKEVFMYYIERDFIGLGKLEPLMKDPNLEDISCDGVNVPIYIYHRNPQIGSVRTNVFFENTDELDTFVNKLAQRCGKSISVASPLIGGTLPNGSRLQATLGTDIAKKGSNFTIRKFSDVPLTPVNLLKSKTIDLKLGAYLWLAIEYGRSMLITGGVATGKTTLLNAMSLFIKPELKIVSIEDTAELVLPHTHWISGVARLPMSELGGKKTGEVDLFDLLRESLRQRPDYLIVGEVRGKEAYVLFQQIATGHSSLSTIHADSMERLVDRLTTPPISLPANLIEALDIVVFVIRIKYGSNYVRRIKSIYEVYGFDRKTDTPLVNEVFRWNPVNDTYDAVKPSMVLKRISQQYGIRENILQLEISRRMKVLDWMWKRNIEDYRDVAKIAKLYYTRAEELLESMA